MLPKKNRFTTKSFQWAFKRSKRIGAGKFLFLVSQEKYQPKFAVVASKKKIKSAAKRNRIRRQIYEIMRTELLPVIKNQNIICLYNGNEILQNSTEIKRAVQKLKRLMPQFKI